MFYFGCWTEAGHHLRDERGQTINERRMPSDFPCGECVLDGGFLPPKQPEQEGLATVAHLNGWTVLAFWDRSIDSRGKSNSAFIMRGGMSFHEACHLAKDAFPSIWSRFKFEIVERKNP